jgi:hypothetical protein
MSFPSFWPVNKFVSTNINASNSITGTYSNTCSLKVNGNSELDGDTIITHLGVDKNPAAGYALDVSGNAIIRGTTSTTTNPLFPLIALNYDPTTSPNGMVILGGYTTGLGSTITTLTVPFTAVYQGGPATIVTITLPNLSSYTTFFPQFSIFKNSSGGGFTFVSADTGATFRLFRSSATGQSSYTMQGTNTYVILNYNPSSKVWAVLLDCAPYNDITYNYTTSTTAITNNLTVGGTTAFTGIPSCSITPSDEENLVNKAYADTKTTLAEVVAANNTWTGTNVFDSNLPTSTVTPSGGTDLVTKTYVDSISGPSILSLNNIWTGTNTFNSSFPTSTLTTSASTNDICNRLTLNTFYGRLGNINAWTNSNTFNTILPSSTLTTSASANDICNRTINDGFYGRLATGNTWTNTNAFPSNLPTSAVVPTTGTQLCNKTYVDTKTTLAAVVAANNTWTGTNAFNTSLPTSTVTPTTSTQLITKAYADATYTGTGILSDNNTWTGTNAFNTSLPTSTLTPTTATQLVTKTYADTKTTLAAVVAANNTWTGTNAFNTSLPTSTVTPTTSTQLITKAYADATYTGTGLLSSNNTWTGSNTFSNLTFSNISSSITLTNPAFQLPLKSAGSNFTALVSSSSTTYAPNATFLTAQGFTGWGFSGTSYTAGIQEGGSGTFYMTYYPIGNQALILAPNGSNMNMKSQNYTLAKGEYVFSFQLQTQIMEPNATITASVVLGSTTIESSPPLNVRGYYPEWTTYDFGFVVPTSGSYYFNFSFISSTGSDYVAISATSLSLVNAMLISDGVNTSAIGGSQSVLNDLYVRNTLTIESGGMNVDGTVNLGTAYGSNNIAINSPIGSVAGTTNSSVIAIGTAALQYGTSLSKFIAIGNNLGVSYATTASNMVVIGGNSQNESNSVIIGYNAESIGSIGYNAVVGSNTGSCIGNYNSVLGCGILASYNGFASIFPDYNCAMGYYSQNANGDSYNTSIGANSLSLINGLTLGIGYNTRYNTAVGYGAGASQARLNYCTFLGAESDVNTNNLSYATAIGAGAIATTSNAIYIGRSSDTTYCVGGLNIPSGQVLTLAGNIVASGLTITPTILGYIQGLTSSAQTQINNILSGASSYTNLTFTGNINSISAATFAYISGLTSSAQTQISNIINGITNIQQKDQYLRSTSIQFTGTANQTLTAPYAETYIIATSGTITINLPTPSAALAGVVFRFRRVNTTIAAINSSAYFPINSSAFTSTVLLTASATTQAGNSIALVCLLRTGITYSWFQL